MSNNIKRLYLISIVFLFSIVNRTYSQNTGNIIYCSDSLYYFQGYYVTVYKKKDINWIQKNKKKQSLGKPFKRIIDNENFKKRFWVSKKDSILSKNYFKKLFNKDKNSIFLLCGSGNKEIFDVQFCNDRLKNKVCEIEWVDADSIKNLCHIDFYDSYCYRIDKVVLLWQSA